ncbi:MAG TPA: helix-turn-helix domain-containing protein [Candidatus Andersenbacteria bacterium]|nr:helix-turn-helix domain-containing protein [Candidatus Andersenbacteria bacterium]
MTLETELAALGLKKNEILVYLAVLRLGEATVGQVEKETGLHKQLIYNAAQSLQGGSLLSAYEVRGRKRFRVVDPGALEDKARARLEKAQALVPQLLELASTKKPADKVRIYRGKRGVQQYYLETMRRLPAGYTAHILGVNSDRFFEIFNQNDAPYQRMEELRIEKKISWRLLLFGAKQAEVVLNKDRLLIELRLMAEAVQSPIDIMIWQESVGLLFYGDEPYVLDLTGSETVKGFTEYFNILWKQGEKVT